MGLAAAPLSARQVCDRVALLAARCVEPLQYHYKREGSVLTLLRNPVQTLTERFPLNRWDVRPVFERIDLVEAEYE
jgi:hypothetical protein